MLNCAKKLVKMPPSPTIQHSDAAEGFVPEPVRDVGPPVGWGGRVKPVVADDRPDLEEVDGRVDFEVELRTNCVEDAPVLLIVVLVLLDKMLLLDRLVKFAIVRLVTFVLLEKRVLLKRLVRTEVMLVLVLLDRILLLVRLVGTEVARLVVLVLLGGTGLLERLVGLETAPTVVLVLVDEVLLLKRLVGTEFVRTEVLVLLLETLLLELLLRMEVVDAGLKVVWAFFVVEETFRVDNTDLEELLRVLTEPIDVLVPAEEDFLVFVVVRCVLTDVFRVGVVRLVRDDIGRVDLVTPAGLVFDCWEVEPPLCFVEAVPLITELRVTALL